MRFTDDELLVVIKGAMALVGEARSERARRMLQSKCDKQSAELKRLYAEVERLKQVAHSRGQLLIDIQKRAMERQVSG